MRFPGLLTVFGVGGLWIWAATGCDAHALLVPELVTLSMSNSSERIATTIELIRRQ